MLRAATLTELKKFMNPPAVMKSVMEVLCILMKVAPERKLTPDTKKVYFDYWGPSVKLLGGKIKIFQEFDA